MARSKAPTRLELLLDQPTALLALLFLGRSFPQRIARAAAMARGASICSEIFEFWLCLKK